VVLLVLVALVLSVAVVVDALSRPPEQVRLLPPVLWAALAILVPIVGPLAWYRWGRQPRQPVPTPRFLGPDDDDDFLRQLRRPDGP
jgi:hypothetical protein